MNMFGVAFNAAFIEGSFAYSLLLGMLAAVNPCGFVLLPTYLVAYLAVDDGAESSVRLRRSLVVGASVSAGFVAVFLIVGTISRVFGGFLSENAKYAALHRRCAIRIATTAQSMASDVMRPSRFGGSPL